MLRIYDFQCPNGHIFESFVDPQLMHLPCTQCTDVADRLISPVRSILDPISGTFPGATMKWARDRAVKLEQERKASE